MQIPNFCDFKKKRIKQFVEEGQPWTMLQLK